jgi:hypothetical protein
MIHYHYLFILTNNEELVLPFTYPLTAKSLESWRQAASANEARQVPDTYLTMRGDFKEI